MRSIERLPEEIHNSVRSGVVICDLPRLVDELVFNSLDSGATKVSVTVGLGSYYVKVADNGSGIVRDDLVLLGERYATSKVDHAGAESFHFRGEALCSISHISLLEVVTKARGKPNGYKKIIKNCKCVFLGINDDIQDTGTTVTARDIFFNQPVRRKHMESSPRKVLDSIKMSVLRIALVHSNVCFKVVDMECDHELLSTGPSPSPLPILFSNFGIENSVDFYHLNLSDGSVKLSGYISGPCETIALKAIQYVYINSRFICKGPIHKLLNQLAANYDLSNSWKLASDSHSEKQNRLHLCPTFILNLNCPRSYYDIVNSERSKTSVEFKDWISVLSFVETGVKQLWMENICHDVPVTSESGRKRRRKQNHQTPLDIPELNKPSKKYEYISDWQASPSSPGIPTFPEVKKNHQDTISFLPDTRKQNHQTSLDIPELNKPPTKYEYIPDWEASPSSPGIPTFPEVKNLPGDISYLPDIDYTSQPCDKLPADHTVTKNPRSSINLYGSSAFSPEQYRFRPYTSGKREDATSYAASLHILPKFHSNVPERSRISSDCLDHRDETDINYGPKKSFLRSCSVRQNLRDRIAPALYESSEFLNDEFRSTNKSISFDNSALENFEPFFCEKEMQIEGSQLFHLSPLTQFDMPERSKFHMGNLIESPLLCENMLLDTPVRVQKCRSQQHFSSGWTPIAKEKSVRFLEEDFVHENLYENNSELGEDTTYGYPTRREDSLVNSTLNANNSWWRQDDSSLDFSPYPKGGSYRKRKRDVYLWDTCEDSPPYPSKNPSEIDCSVSPIYSAVSLKEHSIPKLNESTPMNNEDSLPYPSKYPSEIDCSVLPLYSGVSIKDHSIPKLNESTPMDNGCGRPNSRETTNNRKTGSIRSHSAPPFYRGRKRFSGLNDSVSTLSARSNTEIINKTILCSETGSMNDGQPPQKTMNLENSLKHGQSSWVENSDADCSFPDSGRPSLEKAPEIIRIENGPDLKENEDPFNPGMKWRNNYSSIAGGNSTVSNYKGQDSILDISSDVLCVSGDSLAPKSIDRSSLDNARVLSQVDKKFIALVAGSTLCVIDQHAADERIRLEELRNKVLSGEMKTLTYLDDEKELVLPEIGYQLLQNYADQIKSWGWVCNIHSNDTSSFTKNLDFLHRQPSVVKLLAVPCILGVNLTDTDLLDFLQQLADTDGSSTIPPSVHYILNSKSCRGAIMFGDTLLPSECSLIVEELKRTSLCFQCAHGRPTTVPLVNLDMLQSKIAKLHSENSWHGLSQHELTLERMEQRLRSGC